MADHFNARQIAAIRKQADDLLDKLELNGEEREWCEGAAKVIFDDVTEAHTSRSEEHFADVRPIAVAAAVAMALITAQAWVQRLEQDDQIT